MTFKFHTYDAAALDACGDAFCCDAVRFEKANDRLSTGQWTEFVLDWFAASALPGRLVDSKSVRCTRGKVPFHLAARVGQGEFLVDLTHSSYPNYTAQRPYDSIEYFERALAKPCGVELALESEWGDPDSGVAARVQVLHDAVKVAAMRATAKVVIFGSHRNTRNKVIEDLRALRTQSRDRSPWLVIDVPWRPGGKTTDARSQVLRDAF